MAHSPDFTVRWARDKFHTAVGVDAEIPVSLINELTNEDQSALAFIADFTPDGGVYIEFDNHEIEETGLAPLDFIDKKVITPLRALGRVAYEPAMRALAEDSNL